MTDTATTTHFHTCPLCEATCGLAIEVGTDGRVARVRGDEQDVLSRGFVCPKGASIAALHEDPDRLRAPLVREGERWREVSWGQAFEEIERRLMPILEESGRNAAAVYLGNPNVHNMGAGLYGRPFLKALGTRNIFSASTVDQMPRHVSSGLLYGAPGLIPVPDIDRTDFLLMLGANPLESNGSLCTAPDFPGRLRALRERGGRLVVVDPCRTRTAKLADCHIPIRPGSDVLLLLALAQVVLAEDWVDLGSAAPHVEGLDALRTALSELTPERVARRTGVEASLIRELARDLAAAERAVVYGRIGTHTVHFGTLSSWAADILTLLTGNLDRPGGLMWPLAAHSRASKGEPGGRGFQLGRWRSRVKALPEVMGELPVATLADELESSGDDGLRVLFTIAGNPALSNPNGERLARALAGVELMVSVDFYLNETTRHADVILPPPSPLERSHYDLAFYGLAVRNVANYSGPVFETDAPSESMILSRLALIAMGKGAGADVRQIDELLVRGAVQDAVANEASPLFGADPEDVLAAEAGRSGPDRLLDVLLRGGPYGDRLSLAALESSPHGIDLGALEPRLPGLLRTASGRIELMSAPIVEDLERLHAWLEEAPEEGMLLIGRRHVRSNNSWMHNVEGLMKGRDRCSLLVHPEDARRLGLRDGELAEVRSRVGSLRAPVEIDEAILPGVVSLPHGYGHDVAGIRLGVATRHAGVNTNVLTDEEAYDRPSGTSVLNGIPVSVLACAD